ncbi:MAG TPA: hypothetical protein VHO71_00780 [Caproiciproducens sp.]|nr:hypothetical protein [Caproiciproducens sp.]
MTEKDKSRMDWAKHAAFMGEEYMKLVLSFNVVTSQVETGEVTTPLTGMLSRGIQEAF